MVSDQSAHLFRLADIGLYGQTATAKTFDLRTHLLGLVFMGFKIDRHISTGFGQGHRNGPADSPTGPGH